MFISKRYCANVRALSKNTQSIRVAQATTHYNHSATAQPSLKVSPLIVFVGYFVDKAQLPNKLFSNAVIPSTILCCLVIG